MKKSIFKAIPYLILVTIIALVCAVLEGALSISMMKTIDIAVSGNMDSFKSEAIKLIILALSILPASILLSFG